MKADFSGYATKAGLRCSDGRTIMPGAFKHQDKMKVPLVWQHGHGDVENVLGHAILENRDDGVYTYGFFNKSPKAEHARGLIEHEDITMLSIWANELIEKAGRVLHGAIREVSLVLSGANPGALIENVTIRHDDGDDITLDDEFIIFTGLELEHGNIQFDVKEDEVVDKEDEVVDTPNEKETALVHADDVDDESIEDIYNAMTDKQKTVVHVMLGEVLKSDEEIDEETKEEETAEKADGKKAQHDNTDTDRKGSTMSHNVFENSGATTDAKVLSHADIQSIVADATKGGSLAEAVKDYALAHGIENIDVLFPEAQTLDKMPEFFKRRTEWVSTLIGATRKSPFTRIKTISADLTLEDARAKGYVKGELKREEFFGVTKRVTVPTTVYKKQKLDRDDMVDITDFDVVTWLKAEMRVMLDEEIGRAVLIGDGRDVSHEDKINEGNIRPIAKDHELYTTVVNVNIDDAGSSIQEVIDQIIMNRGQFRGTGMPTFFTTETYISRFLLLKDTVGRRIYKNLDELASELRVTAIVPVEVMEEDPEIVGVIVNPVDYVLGADKGGNVSMFDDFDIDYNQYKYLIETRLSGALVKLKSAMVIKKVAGTDVLVAPAMPAFDGSAITITDQTGVVYTDASDDSVMNNAGSPYAVATGEAFVVNATPASGYYFATSDDDSWRFVGE